MAVNRGVAPPDFETEVGELRAIIGDTHYEELDPPETGFGDYQMFSDGELDSYVARGETFEESVYFAYNSLATSAAIDAKNIKDMDLSVDLTKRATELRLLADTWLGKATGASADIFELFDVVIEKPRCWPEGSPRPVNLWR